MTTPGSPPPRTDSHLHLFDLLPHEPGCLDALAARRERVVTSCHSRAEVAALEAWLAARPALAPLVGLSFGIHPQNPVDDEWEFLQSLVARWGLGTACPRLVAIGECGWDFWKGRASEGLHGEANQDRLFCLQADLARESGLPLVLHIRRAIDKAFAHARRLATVPAVVFHSWPSPPEEAFSLLDKGINAYFSLGTPLLQGNKKAIRGLCRLPVERLLLESDAPYQSLKGQDHTDLVDIDRVHAEAARLRNADPGWLAGVVAENFTRVFGDWGSPVAQAGTKRGSPS